MSHPGRSQFNTSRLLWSFLLSACLFFSAGLLLFSLLPFESARSLADTLALDGSLDSFTPQRFAQLLLPLRAGAIIFLVLTALTGLFPQRVMAILASRPPAVLNFFQRYWNDLRTALSDTKGRLLRRETLLTMLGLSLFAFLARIWFIQAPMDHDEAYTFSVFAVEPLRNALSDYHYPNNHLFHTLLMHISYRLFGISDWAVRLPAFSAGVLLTPLGYLLARRLYGRWSGLLAGAAIASAPVLIAYSVNARGYTLLALFNLIGFILAIELNQRNNYFWWSFLALTCALGVYTVPTFVYSAGMIYSWLALSWVINSIGKDYTRANFFITLVVSGIIASGLALILYLPVIRASGLDAIIANQWVTPVAPEYFWATLVSRTQETWSEWNRGIISEVTALVVVSWMAALAFHQRISAIKLPLQAGLLFLPLVIWLLRLNPWARIWLFLVPLVLIWASGGLSGILHGIQNLIKVRRPVTKYFVILLFVLMVIFSGLHIMTTNPDVRPGSGAVERAAVFLEDRLQDDQIIVVTAIDDAPFWYYARKYRIPQEALRRDRPFQSAYVLVNLSLGQTLESVMRERGPDAVFVAWNSAELIATFDTIEVIFVKANLEAIQREYGKHP
jgi:hypothetical protein